MNALTPRPYQIVGRDFLASRTRALLADEMRVGKTPQAILAAEHAGYGEALVLCPAIAVPHWQREWERGLMRGSDRNEESTALLTGLGFSGAKRTRPRKLRGPEGSVT